MKLKFWGIISALAGLAILTACKTSQPELALHPVTGFDAERYLGKWYELARVENRFEKGMSKVTAEYALNGDGTIKVINAGYDPAKGRFRSATGKAKFANGPDVGALRVSFFGPFYGSYNIVALDRNYQWSIVAGDNPKKYFWVLSRQPKLSNQLKNEALSVARKLGIDTKSLLWVQH
ncbi:lipocalin family protein [Brucella gallinifaecis]|uniref:Outer membrane lipoprotein Blc n=1 Tax=Brucella gallinifaecis TaxID=215590 RepID=A0A502BPX8_9HYPH|nr:lipocalin family protein [Brucella gallinifaecis]TPF75093.1 lipocalin [Brucella gallinifaecis]